jgi:hypothetical protein
MPLPGGHHAATTAVLAGNIPLLDGVFPPPPHSEQKRVRTVPVSGSGGLASEGLRLSGTHRPTAIRLRTEMVGRSVLAEPLNRLSAHRDGFALPLGRRGGSGSARFWTDRREVIGDRAGGSVRFSVKNLYCVGLQSFDKTIQALMNQVTGVDSVFVSPAVEDRILDQKFFN